MKKLLVSLITNTIYYGNVKEEKDGLYKFIGKREDLTDDCIRATFEWFLANLKENEPNNVFEIRFEGVPYVLQMIKEDEKNEL